MAVAEGKLDPVAQSVGEQAAEFGVGKTADAVAEAGAVDIALITDCLVAFALGLLSITRLEMFLRGSRLLDEARRA